MIYSDLCISQSPNPLSEARKAGSLFWQKRALRKRGILRVAKVGAMTEVLASSEGCETHVFRVKNGVLDLAIAVKRIAGNGRQTRGKEEQRKRDATKKETQLRKVQR